MSSPAVLRVAFPFGVLKKDSSLLDPRNTATTWEYYLLENLGAGLLRDDLSEAREYAPGLATAWSQSSPSIWTFEIRQGLKWSDGTPIELSQLAEFFNGLKNSSARHIANLRLLNDVEVDSTRNLLHFHFRGPVGRGVLHELSLADAVVVHPDAAAKGWSLSSGAYTVESYQPDAMKLTLKRNPHSVNIFGDEGPGKVELFWTEEADFSSFFTEHKADIFTSGAFSFRKKVLALDNLPLSRIPGYPTAIYYFQVNPEHEAGANHAVRRAFTSFVQEYFRAVKLPNILSFEDQMVPPGFQGRLSALKPSSSQEQLSHLKGLSLNIGLFPQMEELKPIFEGLSLAATEAGFSIKFEFGGAPTSQRFATVDVFKGNQREASGTWSFLISAPSGPLTPIRKDLESMLLEMVGSSDSGRSEISSAIHNKILDSGLLIPFMNEIAPMYTSQRVDLSRWNPFDMRLRFYDVRFK